MNPHIGEALGYLAAVITVCAYYTKTMIPLRLLGLSANVTFLVYGYLEGVYPTLILHGILLPLNSVRLREMILLTRRVETAVKSDLDMAWLKPFATARRVKAGEILFRRSDAADAMFFLVSGRCRLAELGIEIPAGEVIGELGLLAPDKSRTQTLECLDDGEVLEISYERAKELYYQNPKFGFYFLQLSARRLFENNARLERELAAARRAAVRAAVP